MQHAMPSFSDVFERTRPAITDSVRDCGQRFIVWSQMSLAHLIPVLLKACIVANVFALGLNATHEDVTYLWDRPGKLTKSLLAIFVITPVIAVLMIQAFDTSVGVKVAVLLMAISAGAPVLSKKLLKLNANPPYVYSLAVTSALVAIVTVPVSLAVLGSFFHRQASVPIGQVAYVIAIMFLVPLFAGMVIRYLLPSFEKRVGEPLGKAAFLMLLVLALIIVITTFSAIVAEGVSAFLLIVTITLAELAVGHFMAGPDPRDRTTLALACATRFPALALLIASLNFPDAKPMPIVVTYVLVSNLATFPYVRWRKTHLST
jgi:bile acid:Na+ symporter, BASS family